MRKKDVNNIKRNLSKGKHLKICILDNNSIEFLNHVYDEVSPEKIFSNDRDAYEFVYKAKEMLCKDEYFKVRNNTSVAFKSNDLLIYEWISLGYIKEEYVISFIKDNRQRRRVKFTRKKMDDSIEEQFIAIENDIFIKMLSDNSVHIIF